MTGLTRLALTSSSFSFRDPERFPVLYPYPISHTKVLDLRVLDILSAQSDFNNSIPKSFPLWLREERVLSLLKTSAHTRLVKKLEAGLKASCPTGKTILHTAPHHVSSTHTP